MAKTYEKIATHTFSGSTSDVEFTSIPSTYTDIIAVINGRGAYSAGTVLIQSYLNNDFTTIYSMTTLRGTGSSASSTRSTGFSGLPLGYIPGATATAGMFGTIVAHYQNYANSNTFKTVLSRGNNTDGQTAAVDATVGLYRSTSAITRIGIATYGVGNFVSGSTVTIYGVKSA